MNSRKSVLLVDPDSTSTRVLEVSLRKVGYLVTTASTASEALRYAIEAPPALVVTETTLPDYDGFELVRRLRADERTARTLVIFLTGAGSADAKVRGIDVGADEFLTKPVLVKELISRTRALLERREQGEERSDRLSGTLSSMGLVDILQVLETGRKSGTARLSSDPVRSGGYVEGARQEGFIHFRDGRVVDAELDRLQGSPAVHRMMLWEDGFFEIDFGPLDREDRVQQSPQDLLMEALRSVDLWARFAERLPLLSSRMQVDLQVAAQGTPLPREVQQVVAGFDGRRTLFEVAAASPLPDETTLQILTTLHERGALHPDSESSAEPETLQAWLSSAEISAPSEISPDPLPSALGQAAIPSDQSPSQILQALPPSETGLPLLRQTVTASADLPAMSRVPETASPRSRPSLKVQRLGSSMDSLPAMAAIDAQTGAPPDSNIHEVPPLASEMPKPTRWSDLPPPDEAASPFDRPVTQVPDPRRAETVEIPRPHASESLEAQTAAWAHSPPAYTPSEASTFKDDFFQSDGASEPEPKYGPPSWVLGGLGLLALVFVIFLVVNLGPSEGDGPRETTTAPRADPSTPEERAQAAMAAASKAEDAQKADPAEPTSEDPAEAQANRAEPAQDPAPEGTAAKRTAPKKGEPSPAAQAPRTERPEPSVPDPETAQRVRARRFARAGDQALEKGQLSEAESQYRQALELDPRNADAQSGLAFVHMERAEDDRARRLARSALSIDRRQARAHLVLGLIAFNQNDRDQARRAYQTYLSLAPRGRHAQDVRAALENLQ